MSKYLLIISFFLGIFSLQVKAEINEDVPNYQYIVDAVAAGDINTLSNSFASQVEMDILGKKDNYSDYQAKKIIENFFKQHNPTSFKIVHKCDLDSTSFYLMGELASGGSVFELIIKLVIDMESSKVKIRRIRVPVVE